MGVLELLRVSTNCYHLFIIYCLSVHMLIRNYYFLWYTLLILRTTYFLYFLLLMINFSLCTPCCSCSCFWGLLPHLLQILYVRFVVYLLHNCRNIYEKCRLNSTIVIIKCMNYSTPHNLKAIMQENELLKEKLSQAQSLIRQQQARIRQLQLQQPTKKNMHKFEQIFNSSSQEDNIIMKSMGSKFNSPLSSHPLERKISEKVSPIQPSPEKMLESRLLSPTHRQSLIINLVHSPRNHVKTVHSAIFKPKEQSKELLMSFVQASKKRNNNNVKVVREQAIGKKQIFNSFFVTSINERGQPIILYSYPRVEQKLKNIMSLFYGENSVQNKQQNSRDRENIRDARCVKDKFIMPLLKDGEEGWDYLVACETDGIQYQKVFPRFYCFITGCHLVVQLQQLLTRFIQCTRGEVSLLSSLQSRLANPLKFLQAARVTEGEAMQLQLDAQIKFVAEWRRYFPQNALNRTVHFRQEGEGVRETALLGVIAAYLLAEVKVVLYSAVKSRLSDVILAVLELVKPLQYVSPVIMALLTAQHQQFVHSPVPLLLGYWTEPSRKAKKLQIVFNQKEGTVNLIERGLLHIPQGILIHLDTGLVFGSALQEHINQAALLLNALKDKVCKTPKNVAQLFTKILSQKTQSNSFKQVWNTLKPIVEPTQLYSYYRQKKQHQK